MPVDIKSLREELKDRFVVVYSGSIKKWQCFDCVVELFYVIRSLREDAYLLIATQESWVESFLSRIPSLNYPPCFKVVSVEQDEIAPILKIGKIGLIIREDSLVNRYACPIKFGEYLAAGLHVITTPFSEDFYHYFFSDPRLTTTLPFPPLAPTLKKDGPGWMRRTGWAGDAFFASIHGAIRSAENPELRKQRQTVAFHNLSWDIYLPRIKTAYDSLWAGR